MRTRFLLGPAGSGKTTRCLQEIRAELQSANSDPILLLAPKQATFQLERALLMDKSCAGYTRLQILSFERFSEMILAQYGGAPREILSEEGRLMVLRALLLQLRDQLEIFHASARLRGFAQQASLVLAECQRHGWTGKDLVQLAERVSPHDALSKKLRDLAKLLDRYLSWIESKRLLDAHAIVGLAARLLESRAASGLSGFQLGGLWLDGFAELTQQEVTLLAVVLPNCKSATLAFCMECGATTEPSWTQPYSIIGQTYLKCRNRLNTVRGMEVTTEVLERRIEKGRFSKSTPLFHLESEWWHADPTPWNHDQTALGFGEASNPDTESMFVAREIVKFVRDRGGRYRDVAVLTRSLEGYYAPLARWFRRYGIPFFMDRRESVAHHPLVELTRSAVRLAVLGWEQEDWFAALKTGLVTEDEDRVDWLERQANRWGWEGKEWLKPLTRGDNQVPEQAEKLRLEWITPFVALNDAIANSETNGLDGIELAALLDTFWRTLRIDLRLKKWAEAIDADHALSPSVHSTVWEELQNWNRNLELGFANQRLQPKEWLTILEAGWGSLTVGIVPPSLDQVLIGTLDRSRNTELKLAFLMGANEGLFPRIGGGSRILTEREHTLLKTEEAPFAIQVRQEVARELYLAYIGLTRSGQQTWVTWSLEDVHGSKLNRSLYVDRLIRIFPTLQPQVFDGVVDSLQTQHPLEIAPSILRAQFDENAVPAAARVQETLLDHARTWPPLQSWLDRVIAWSKSTTDQTIPTDVAARLYGSELRTSVSALEDFGWCPHQFFIARGLRADEETEFIVDPTRCGSFQHELLKALHDKLVSAGKTWRETDNVQAMQWLEELSNDLLRTFEGGLFTTRTTNRFAGQHLVQETKALVDCLLNWMGQYQLDPMLAEFSFGLTGSTVPGLSINLDEKRRLILRGRIDRIDWIESEERGKYLAAVIDYKHGQRKADPVKVAEGLELQLLSYLLVLEELSASGAAGLPKNLESVGAFFVATKGRPESPSKRKSEDLSEDSTKRTHQHRGFYNQKYLRLLDNRNNATKGDQFQYQINKDGTFSKRQKDGVSADSYRELLTVVRSHLINFGNQILSGTIAVAPAELKGEKACDRCRFLSICRFDSWNRPYRSLGSKKT